MTQLIIPNPIWNLNLTNLEIRVLSREKAKRYTYGNHVEKSAIISITDVNSEPLSIHLSNNNNIISVLKLSFDDVEINERDCITTSDAKEIADFVNSIYDKIDLLIVHCEAGVSRSAGVAAAIMLYLKKTDMPIFDNPRMCPNMMCYRMILNALMYPIDELATKEKESHNTVIWRKANDLD